MKRIIELHKNKFANNVSCVLENINTWLHSCGYGEYILEMKKKPKPRTINQNRLMWLWFNAIAKEWSDGTGRVITSQNVHDAYCEMFLPVDTPKGRVGGETKGLSTDEMATFLDKIQADAAGDGIVLPNPEDKMFEHWRMQYEL